jgi:hypothetical protein
MTKQTSKRSINSYLKEKLSNTNKQQPTSESVPLALVSKILSFPKHKNYLLFVFVAKFYQIKFDIMAIMASRLKMIEYFLAFNLSGRSWTHWMEKGGRLVGS